MGQVIQTARPHQIDQESIGLYGFYALERKIFFIKGTEIHAMALRALSLAVASGLALYLWRRRQGQEKGRGAAKEEVSWADRAVQAAKDAMETTTGRQLRDVFILLQDVLHCFTMFYYVLMMLVVDLLCFTMF